MLPRLNEVYRDPIEPAEKRLLKGIKAKAFIGDHQPSSLRSATLCDIPRYSERALS
jgi:hypothetical protein